MPVINTAEDAVNAAERFVNRYHAFRVLKRVARENSKWVTEFDVAILGSEIVRVTLDAETGSVIEYTQVTPSGH
ncbi:MAG: hypothetical protein HY665_00820 [Chloroflexi bacterium]|nr:hypothetical protein [Chloroflexota bacterium]